MKIKTLTYIIVLALLALLPYNKSYARSGCCSHHGGVCGCGCCDGTGLSATCAPYYPQCNSSPSVKTVPKVPATPTCSANAYYSATDGKCYCNTGYCVNTSKLGCVLLPTNAHCVESSLDSWQCDYGYEEKGNYCVVKTEEKPVVKNVETTKEELTTEPINSSEDEPEINTTPTATTSTSATTTSSQNNNEDNGNWLAGLVTLGGIYAGKKYLDKKKDKKQTEL